MFKLVVIAGIMSLLAACSAGPGFSSYSSDNSNTAGPPRSPGEGPAFNPYYGGGSNK